MLLLNLLALLVQVSLELLPETRLRRLTLATTASAVLTQMEGKLKSSQPVMLPTQEAVRLHAR